MIGNLMTSAKAKGEREVLKPEVPHSLHRSFALDLLEGLSQTPKRIPSVYLYDKKGSELFRQITELEDYYLTQSEQEILTAFKNEISEYVPRKSFNLIELGSGDGRKTVSLIEWFLKKQLQFEYITLDISPESVDGLTLSLEEMFSPGLKVTGIVAEYFEGLTWLAGENASRNLTLFLGSNIGNFEPHAARRFLRCLWDCLRPRDQVLIGFDLKKDIEVLNRAYNDPEGITREFNLNLLDRINRELGGEFERENFVYYGSYQVATGAVESYLVSTREQEVFIRDLDAVFSFEAWEPIHTECSHKFLESEIASLAEETGFEVRKNFFDKRRYFVDSLWRVIKPRRAWERM